MAGEATRQDELLSNLGTGSVVTIFSASVGTGVISTGTNINVGGARELTLVVDLTGSVATGVLVPTVDIRAGISGLGFTLLRSVTATADQTLFFKVGGDAATTGASANTTGITTIWDFRIEVHPSSTVTGGDVTCRAQAILPRF